jgi:hypothetical protein
MTAPRRMTGEGASFIIQGARTAMIDRTYRQEEQRNREC